MRALSRNEQILAGAFLALVVALGGMALFSFLRGSLAAERKQKAALTAELEELNTWIGQGREWEQRAEWIAANPPPVWRRDESEAELVGELQSGLAEAGIEILNQRLLETESSSGFREVGLQLQLRGTTEALVRWLHQLQQPGKYVGVRQLNLKSDADKTSLRAEIHLVRHYREAEGAPEPSPE